MKIQTSVRVEKKFYKEAKKVFEKFGLSFADAVNIFLAKVSMTKSIPFSLDIPNEETKNAIEAARKGEIELTSLEDLKRENFNCYK
jgi:DNA-damage-inducible protein J